MLFLELWIVHMARVHCARDCIHTSDKLEQLLHWNLEFCVAPLLKKGGKKKHLSRNFCDLWKTRKSFWISQIICWDCLVNVSWGTGEKTNSISDSVATKNFSASRKMWCHDIRQTLVCQIIFFFPRLDGKHIGNSVGARRFCVWEVICNGSLHDNMPLCEAVTP